MIFYYVLETIENSQLEIREPDKNDFVSNDMEDDLDKEQEIELESEKKLDKIYNFLSCCSCLI